MAKVDREAETVTIDDKGIMRVDGLPVFAIIMRGDEPFLQFVDKRPWKKEERGGSQFIEVSLDALFAKIVKHVGT